MRKMTSEHLNDTDGKGDARKLCNEIRSIEASRWYDSRNQAKRVGAGQGGAGGTGARWCDKCQSSSHSTEKCWGRCGTCNKFGHPTDRCWENPANGKPQGAAGAAKTVQVPSTLEPIPPTGPTPEEIAAKKAKQKEKNKRLALKRKEKKAKKKKEAEEAKSAADTGRQHLHFHLSLQVAAARRIVQGNHQSEAELLEYLETQQKRVYTNSLTPSVKMS